MKLENFTHFFYDFFIDSGWSEALAVWVNFILNLLVFTIIASILRYAFIKLFRSFLSQVAAKTKTKFDDYLFSNKAIINLANLIVLIVGRNFITDFLIDFSSAKAFIMGMVDIAIIIMFIWMIRTILHSFKDYLRSLKNFKDKPIESYIQVFMIITWMIGIVLISSIVTNKSIADFLTAIGALSAVLLLIFKDSILGFVASIQVSVNDTVRIGDWITMEKYGADGTVIEINLSSVKVKNFDYTITTIPTYYLNSDSFTNWRGMQNSNGRRIKRSILIKANSIHYLTGEEIEELKKIQLITAYLNTRTTEIDKYNTKNEIDKSLLINGRNLTNFGVFRKYVDQYLSNHSALNKDMLMMSRQLAPTPHGVPLEIYAFSRDKVWKNYEHIVSDIFDHLLAAVPYFKLEVFEPPTTHDIQKITQNNTRL